MKFIVASILGIASVVAAAKVRDHHGITYTSSHSTELMYREEKLMKYRDQAFRVIVKRIPEEKRMSLSEAFGLITEGFIKKTV